MGSFFVASTISSIASTYISPCTTPDYLADSNLKENPSRLSLPYQTAFPDNDNDSDTANTLSQKQLLTEVEEELKKSLPQHAEIKASTNKELQKKVLAQPAQLDQPRPNKLPANASSAADATSSHSKQNPQRRSQESQPETKPKPKPKPEPQPQQPQHITLPAGNRNGSGSSNVSKNGKQRAGRKLK